MEKSTFDSDDDDEEKSINESIKSISDDEEIDDGDEEDEDDDAEEKNISLADKETEDISLMPSSSKVYSDDEEDSDYDELYLQKFDEDITNDYISKCHPEDLIQNYNEILTLSNIVRDNDNNIIDKFHKTAPILSKYEKTKILGQRTKQLNNGAAPFIKINEKIIDSYLIAEMELKEKALPFIIRRPLPNGNSEYWSLSDLELL